MLPIPDLQRALQDLQPHRAVPRRLVLAGLAGILPVWAMPDFPTVDAKKNKKKRKRKRKNKKDKKPENNAFGCLNVGQHCNGKDDTCCSGVCDGKKPKKGKKDKSACVAHNVDSCDEAFDGCEGILVTCGLAGTCVKTTGNAPFCGGAPAECVPCQRDADCVAQGFGVAAACVLCSSECALASGGTACFAAAD